MGGLPQMGLSLIGAAAREQNAPQDAERPGFKELGPQLVAFSERPPARPPRPINLPGLELKLSLMDTRFRQQASGASLSQESIAPPQAFQRPFVLLLAHVHSRKVDQGEAAAGQRVARLLVRFHHLLEAALSFIQPALDQQYLADVVVHNGGVVEIPDLLIVFEADFIVPEGLIQDTQELVAGA